MEVQAGAARNMEDGDEVQAGRSARSRTRSRRSQCRRCIKESAVNAELGRRLHELRQRCGAAELEAQAWRGKYEASIRSPANEKLARAVKKYRARWEHEIKEEEAPRRTARFASPDDFP